MVEMLGGCGYAFSLNGAPQCFYRHFGVDAEGDEPQLLLLHLGIVYAERDLPTHLRYMLASAPCTSAQQSRAKDKYRDGQKDEDGEGNGDEDGDGDGDIIDLEKLTSRPLSTGRG